jgi:hypothetical protein
LLKIRIRGDQLNNTHQSITPIKTMQTTFTKKQVQLVEMIKVHGQMYVGRSNKTLYKSHVALVEKGVLRVVSEDRFGTTFDTV